MFFSPLHTASAFSFLAGASLPEELAERAAELEMPALALVDRDGVYGAPRFEKAARKLGVRPMHGAELTCEDGSLLPLLVESPTGYRNLCRLITRMNLRAGSKGEGRLRWSDLEEFKDGLVALTGADEGPLAVALAQGGAEAARRRLRQLAAGMGRSRLYVELQRHYDREQEQRNQLWIAWAQSERLPLVATNGARSARPSGRVVLDVMTCLRRHVRLDQAGRRLERNSERYLKSAAQMQALFADLPEAVAATSELAERLQFSLKDLGYEFPRVAVPEGETMASWLRHLTGAGARRRYRPYHPRARRQIAHELEVITRLGLEGYFLVVEDIMRFCREQGILAQGRGSAANSAVCYSLGITAVDPVGMELLFERFLSEERGEWPDIDIDLPSGGLRERVIQYVYDRYNRQACASGPGAGWGAAMTANVITWRSRGAAREVGKVLGFPEELTTRLAQLLGSLQGHPEERESGSVLPESTGELRVPPPAAEVARPVEEMLRRAGFDPRQRHLQHFLRLCTALQDLPRHLGQHSGGMIVCQGQLDRIVPLEKASMPGRVVVQWDKEDCADLGIIKVDLLGLGMMAVLQDALVLTGDRLPGAQQEREERTAASRAGSSAWVDLAWIPPEDPAVYHLLQQADTIGVFQVESRAQMATLPRLRPERFYDLVVEVALIRPGPIVGRMVHPYIRRRNGEEPVTYPHPLLEPILRRTLGVPLFQEQLLRMAMAVAGFSGGEAEELRRALGFKRSQMRMDEVAGKLRRGMAALGITGTAADQIVLSITSFALYGFPESHAASFALLVYASAYFKVHFPEEFYACMLNHQPMGFYHPATLVKDAQRRGVRILPVSVDHSEWECRVVELPGPDPKGRTRAVRLGLRYAAGLRREAAESVLSARRAGGCFSSVDDLAERTRLNRAEARRLAEIGALWNLGLPRRAALWQVEACWRDSGELFAGTGAHPPGMAAPLPAMDAEDRMRADYRGTGLTLGPHPMALRREALRKMGAATAADLQRMPNGRRVRTAGVVIARQRPMTAKGLLFVSLEDETGIGNLVVSPELFERERAVCVSAPLLYVEGILQRQGKVVHVRVERLQSLDFDQTDTTALRLLSHDFH